MGNPRGEGTEVLGSFTVLSVCAGNIHRSALAAQMLGAWSQWYLPPGVATKVHSTSAGLIAAAGVRMGDRTQAIVKALGAHGSSHRSRPLTDRMVQQADLVLTATREQRDAVLQRVPSALRYTFTMREAGRIAADLPDRSAPAADVTDLRHVVTEFSGRRGRAGSGDDIVDPQGQPEAMYFSMLAQELPALAHLARVLFGMPRGDVTAYLAAAEDRALLTRGR